MMDREKIKELAQQLETKEGILTLLNRIKQSDMEDIGVPNSHRFTIRHINYYCNPNHIFHRYRQFKVKKKTGGERTITAPRTQTYRLLLRYLNEILKAIYMPSDFAMGFTEGRSIVNNAQKHIGKNYVFNIDLKDFFPSIDKSRVWKRLQLSPFNFSSDVAHIIAGLCCMKGKRLKGEIEENAMFLPQGAPTSPIITNMICDTLDRRLAGLAKRFGLTYTRYADDITFSSMHNVYHENGDFRTELQAIIAGQGFTINNKKTRLQKLGSRQEVTGIIVSDKINVTQKYIRNIRNILYIWERYGIIDATSKFLPKYKNEKGHVKKGEPNIVNVLEGKLLYLKMVRGESDSVYLRLYQKFRQLADEHVQDIMTSKSGVTYLQTLSLLEFESSQGDVVIKTNENGNRWAEFRFGEKGCIASIQKGISFDNKNSLSISICKNSTGELFWLIHKSFTIRRNDDLILDELNNELNNLLNMYDGR